MTVIHSRNSQPRNRRGDQMPKELKTIVRDMGGSDVTLLVDKRLHEYDASQTLNRLLLPQCEMIKKKFITLDELSLLKCESSSTNPVSFLKSDELSRLSSSKAEIPVLKFLEANWKNEEDVEYKDFGDTINLKRRAMTGSYLLTTGWSSGLARTRVRSGTRVQLWSFRVGSQLCFALDSLCMLDC